MPTETQAVLTCAACSREPTKQTGRLPSGWKRNPTGDVLCERCWRERYILRAISIPVVKPLGATWQEFRVALQEAWSHCTGLANWAVAQTFARDEQRTPEQAKLAKMPKVYLYPDAASRFPALPSRTVAAIVNAVQGKYRKKRYEVLWTCEASLPNARYPQPFVSPNQSWTPAYVSAGAEENGDKLPAVEVTLLRGQRFTLQLRGGRDFRRQLGDFAQLVGGVAVKGELALLRQRVSGMENRNGVTDRDSGGQRTAFRVMVKLVGWFPRRVPREAEGTLFVRTTSDAFLVALDADEERIWWLNADHVRRWVAEHRNRLQRWSEDQKAEQRPIASFQSRREAAVLKFRHRIDSFTKEAAAQLANFARRRRIATVRLDDSERGYLQRFDWSGFRVRLRDKLDEFGITLELASAESGVDAHEEETQKLARPQRAA